MATHRRPSSKPPHSHKSHRKPKRSWNTYVGRSLKAINAQMSMSHHTMKIVNSYVNDVMERICTEAALIVRANKKSTLGAREVQTAVRIVLPVELAKHAMAEGTKAVSKMSR
ncbi:histone H2B [Leishmania major strain Friedlin]|uniref:Histone H2B n=1 Tax=Leishmania major TaxID=5664 RepID=Q9U8C0_LEIMA|nr:histone H2B [Leishmania major strain Friedlin]AAF04632.1 histone H2B variant 2 [Leishmania major]CAG9572355.1 histone_H2B [Leishmania major strain Friedlin]CAJ03947.1 histone H2B [Leishmania major strain Friedlin]|eukprot:XP_001682379.1 histone H2B [Leishmania major strain Friedlin]